MMFEIDCLGTTSIFLDTNVIIVNIGELRKDKEIAAIIRNIKSHKPKVIGLDITLDDQSDSGDFSLQEVFYQYPDLVLGIPMKNCGGYRCDSIVEPYFPYENKGHVVGSDGYDNNGELYFPQALLYTDSSLILHISLQILKTIDYSSLYHYMNSKCFLGYRRLRFLYPQESFKVVKGSSILANDCHEDFKDKIVLIGYVGEERVVSESTNDLHNVCLENGEQATMYGVFVLANSILMVLDPVWRECLDELPVTIR